MRKSYRVKCRNNTFSTAIPANLPNDASHSDSKNSNFNSDTKTEVPLMEFTKASGSSITTSKKALSTATKLLIDEFSESENSEGIYKVQKETNKIKEEVQNIGFQTASGQRVHISSKALTKATALFQEQSDELERQLPNAGFQTANGQCINVSSKALSKAALLFQEEANEFKEEILNDEFFMGGANQFEADVLNLKNPATTDQGINVSIKALSKAQTLPQNKTNELKAQLPNVGFQTASGQCLNVSSKALSKATLLFQEANELKEEILNDEFFMGGANQFEADVLNLKNPATTDQSINVSIKALSKAQTLPQNKTNELKAQLTNVGFQTASGQSLNVSSKALSKAALLFQEANEFKEEILNDEFFMGGANQFVADVLNFKNPATTDQSINVSIKALSKAQTLPQNKTNELKAQLSNVGFQTASGQCLNISSKALSKAESLIKEETAKFVEGQFQNVKLQTASEQCCNITKETVSNEKPLFERNVDEFKEQLQNIGFQTASGQCVNISNQALSKATSLFEEETKELEWQFPMVEPHVASEQYVSIAEKAQSKTKTLFSKKVDKLEVRSPLVRFQPVCREHVNVTPEAKRIVLYQDKVTDISKNNSVLTRPLQKRKINNLDDNISLNQQNKPNQFKKLRFSNEFQDSKPVQENKSNIKHQMKESDHTVSTDVQTMHCNNDKLNHSINNVKKSMVSNNIIYNTSISHEIAASTVALLADERDSNFSEKWIPSSESKENEETATFPSSPVIGGQFIPKKRRGSGGKKKIINTLTNKRDSFICIDKSKEISNNFISSDPCGEENKCLVEKQFVNTPAKCDNLPVNEYGDTQLMLDFINHSATVIEKRLQAALQQDQQIILKQGIKPNAIVSKLYLYKTNNANNRISWKTLSKGSKPILCTHEELTQRKIQPEILNITSSNALEYKFRCADFYGQNFTQNNIDGIKLEDGACLILDENGYAGITEIKRSFLASSGVNPNLLPTGWVENHYKWIVWKLASVDRIKFESATLSRALTPDRVLMELQYRYEREINRSERSAIKKILEKDDTPSKRMILCVSSILETESTITSESSTQFKPMIKKLMLTDGWYCVPASLDQQLIKSIISGKVKEGTKLVTYGAELVNSEQGHPPLEIPENVCLKLHANSTRRARWDMKLGYVVPVGPMCIKLGTISPNGGLIGKIKVLVARVYPLLYHEKTPDGESIFRNVRCEEKANIAYEKQCRSTIEAFYAKAEKYLYMGKKKSNLETDSIDLAAYEWNKDCEKLSKEEFLSEQEIQQLKNDCRAKETAFKEELESRLKKSLPPPRKVTTVLKIRITEGETNALLSIWSPSEEVTDILKEDNCVSVCNIMPSTKRGNELQLTANRSTLFRLLNVPHINYPVRTYTALCDIEPATFNPAYGEFDTVGLITCIKNEPCGMKNFEAVFLAHPYSGSRSSYLSILFWQGISFHGYAEILTVGSFVACNNLEWRRPSSWSIPMSYCTDRSTFTRNPRQNHLQQPFIDLNHLITDVSTYINMCTTDISEKMQKKSIAKLSDQIIPVTNNVDKILINESINSNEQCMNYSSVLEELQGSSLINTQPAKSPAIQKRLEKLQWYGEPPSLSPIVLNNSSKRVSLEFQSPLRSKHEKSKKFCTSLNVKYTGNRR